MTNIQRSLFDYSNLSIEIAVKTQISAERIKLRLRRTAEDIVEIGKELIEVKANLPHGQFLPWIESEFRMSDQSAQNFMNVAERFGDQIPNNLEFSPTVLYLLAQKSTPDEVIQKVIEKAENGESTSIAELKKLKAEVLAKESLIADLKTDNTQLKRSLSEVQAKPPDIVERVTEVIKEVIPSDYETLKAELATAEQVISQLESDYDALEAKQVVPEGYTSIEQAIAAKTKELKQIEDKQAELKAQMLRVEANLKRQMTLDNQAKSDELALERFHNKFLSLVKDHPEAIAAMSSHHISSAWKSKVNSLINCLDDWASTMRSYLDKSDLSYTDTTVNVTSEHIGETENELTLVHG